MELSGPGVQYIADNQLYNSIITAHAILMSAPIRFTKGSLQTVAATDKNSRVRSYQVGEIKPHGETQTIELIVKGMNGINPWVLRIIPDPHRRTLKLMNLIRTIRHNRTSAEYGSRTVALSPSILSLVSMLFKQDNGISHKVNTKYAESLLRSTSVRNFGIAYGNEIKHLPNNTI